MPYLTGPADFGDVTPIARRWTEIKKAVSIKDDILITVKGAGIGKTNILGYDRAAISRQLMTVRPIIIDRSFIKIVLDNSYMVFQNQRTGIAIPGIGRDEVLHHIMALPPLAEQHRIVTKVDQLIKLCDELETMLIKAQTKSQKLMEATVTAIASN
ncbi:MAG TPA: restriction endonuclease subunit S [Syntrophales bacterium]|nr:restriction endonuclease subunit S [Syntrophales bacterium]